MQIPFCHDSKCHSITIVFILELEGRFIVVLYAVMCRILRMYDVKDEDIDSIVDPSQPSTVAQAPLEMQLPILELLKVYFLIFIF